MADNRTLKMAEFYEQCEAKGYMDMSDSTQSLKAKVIATDLGLKYKNMQEFFQEAESCYRKVQEEKQQQIALEARRAVPGELLLEFNVVQMKEPSLSPIRVFRRADGTVYSETKRNNGRVEGIPVIAVGKGGVLSYTYHPAKTVYTGATVGGVTTGGFHTTQASYSERLEKSGKGYLTITLSGGEALTVTSVAVTDNTKERFKHDKQFNSIVKNGVINCEAPNASSDFWAKSAVGLPGVDYNARVYMASKAADEKRLSYAECVEIAGLIGRIVNAEYPPDDKQLYDEACRYADSSKSADLKKALEIFAELGDYRDSGSRKEQTQQQYEERLQHEKEQAILAKEAAQEKRRKTGRALGITAVVSIILIMIVAFGIVPAQKKSRAYQEAGEAYSKGNYVEAYRKYSGIKGYKNVNELLNSDSNLMAAARVVRTTPFRTVGNIVTFGSYEQGGSESNGKRSVEWIVLKNEGNQSLLLSKLVLAFTEFYDGPGSAARWEKCIPRAWMNDDFYHDAFSAQQQEAIIIPDKENAKQDKVFLLTNHEIYEYLPDADDRRCGSSVYNRFFAGSGGSGYVDWWYCNGNEFGFIDDRGLGYGNGEYNLDWADHEKGIRPAIWVDLESEVF